MPIEVTCGACQGRLMIESAGVVVACPHCGAHLSIPVEPATAGVATETAPASFAAETSPSAPASLLPAQGKTPAPDFGFLDEVDESAAAPTPPVPATPVESSEVAPPTEASIAASGALLEASGSVVPPVARAVEQADVPAEQQTEELAEAPPTEAAGSISPKEPAAEAAAGGALAEPVATPPVTGNATPVLASAAADDRDSAAPASTDESSAETFAPVAAETRVAFAASAERAQAARRGRGVSKSLFLVVCSYASAVTIWLIITILSGHEPHGLENLPDVVPPMTEDGKIGLKLVPESATVPPGHVLGLGEQQRFGNLVIEPIEVTRGPVSFVHFNDPGKKRTPDGPVLKLWVQFRNVSADQVFPPLGHELLGRRVEDEEHPGRLRANNFVCRSDQKRRDGRRFLPYDLPSTSDWDLEGQNVNAPLKPGETVTTYIASEPGIDELKGELVWRVHFRKGYHPKTLRGVTTVIEVSFHSDEVRNET